jgi:hypothetical protein
VLGVRGDPAVDLLPMGGRAPHQFLHEAVTARRRRLFFDGEGGIKRSDRLVGRLVANVHLEEDLQGPFS